MRVAILGCGYVGIELARQLDAAGHHPVGVRRSDDGIETLETHGIDAVQADVTDADSLARVPDVDALVFIASSGGRDAAAAREVYVDGLRTAVDAFAARDDAPDRLVYTSSTGVYGDHGGDWVDESTPLEPTTEKTRVLTEAEDVARSAAEYGMTPTVVRFAGLYGPDRYRLDRYLDGPVTEGYLNMIHRDDAAGVVRFALDEPGDDTLLAVDDEPVSKWEFADWLADQCDRQRPPKRTKEERLDDGDLSEAACRRVTTSKRCSNHRLHERGYDFQYPTFREGYRAAVDARRSA
ncbi:SDR family oxidoreductase [Halocalculus aciditolerans]|uniref:NAD(P)-dependent oxidoreductase n=1 Tax=Halocalculus aciditolerans TaxID=1383812 RepID=A0A830FB73_9EURY|nr:SDR family oxidoreductase [Halocalculus aciditolerans]GGL72527.1 NAD(P)-dependent oxidoreductase [Halocalculus aciditolerans]